MEQNKLYEVALSLVENVGDITIRHLISYCGSAEAVFKSNKSKITGISGIGEVVYNNLQDKKYLIEAEKIMRLTEKNNSKIIFYLDTDFPKRLKSIYDAPSILYYRGNFDFNLNKSIGIVGTRRASDYGKKITESIIEGLTAYNPMIISGLAYGIDITAHKAAINNNLPTLAILAGGLDKIYPKEHIKFLDKIEQNGGIISEKHFGLEPIRSGFLARNRIISALSDAVIVAESAAKGGSLVTAEYANNYHREVFAVPGNIGNPTSEGCNILIENHKARIYNRPENIIESLSWDIESSGNDKFINVKTIDLDLFSEQEAHVIATLRDSGEQLIDDLSWKTQIPLNKLASILLNLEFQSIVKPIPGKKFSLIR